MEVGGLLGLLGVRIVMYGFGLWGSEIRCQLVSGVGLELRVYDVKDTRSGLESVLSVGIGLQSTRYIRTVGC